MISHKHQCIFVHIPKCAGTSIASALGHLDNHTGRGGQDHVVAGEDLQERLVLCGVERDALLARPADHITPLRGSELWQAALLEMWLQVHGL